MSHDTRYCPQCKTKVHRSQTLCVNCQTPLPAEKRSQGRCFCCGQHWYGPLHLPHSGPTGTGTVHLQGQLALVTFGHAVTNSSCLGCGDPQPLQPSYFSEIGLLLVVLQALAWGVMLGMFLHFGNTPYHLSGGKALLSGVVICVALAALAVWSRRRFWLAPPLFILLVCWPFFVDGSMHARMQLFAAALLLNLLAVPLLLKVRRKPFGKW